MSFEGLDDYLNAMSSIAEGEAMTEEHRYWVTTIEDNHGDFDNKEFADLEDATRYAVKSSKAYEWVICVKDTADRSFTILLLAHNGILYHP